MIVVIGDSLTAGQYLPPGGEAWPSLIVGHAVHAAGVPNDTTRLGLERFPREVQERRPEAVVIQFGHNDCNRWESDGGLYRVSPTAFQANMAEMVQRARAFGVEPLICSLIPTEKATAYKVDVSFYNSLIVAVGSAFGVGVIPVRESFLVGEGLYLGDGIHLSQLGHHRYAEAVQAALDARFA